MELIDYQGWPNCVRLSNDRIEVVATTAVGPRIVQVSFLGQQNLVWLDPELLGTTGPPDEWVNYGGHRLWHAPEVFPRTYQPDNEPVHLVQDGNTAVLVQPTEKKTGVRKAIAITIADGGVPAVKVEHHLSNQNPWTVTLAPWALTVVAHGGRVIIPSEPYQSHGQDNNYLPARSVALWPFTNLADPRWSWGKEFIQLRSDAAVDEPQKIGVFNSLGWAVYTRPDGYSLLLDIDIDSRGPAAYPDFGSNFETFTKGAFQELETLGASVALGPGETTTHIQYWTLFENTPLPSDDRELAESLPALAAHAQKTREYFESIA